MCHKTQPNQTCCIREFEENKNKNITMYIFVYQNIFNLFALSFIPHFFKIYDGGSFCISHSANTLGKVWT